MFGGISNTGVVTSVVYQPMAKCPQCGIPNQVSGRFSVGQTSTFSNMFTLAQNQQIAIHSQCKSLVRTSSNQGFKKKTSPSTMLWTSVCASLSGASVWLALREATSSEASGQCERAEGQHSRVETSGFWRQKERKRKKERKSEGLLERRTHCANCSVFSPWRLKTSN